MSDLILQRLMHMLYFIWLVWPKQCRWRM